MNQSLLNFETLSFRIGLSGTYWYKKPEFTVLVNDKEMASGSIDGLTGQVQYVEFTESFEENSTNKFQIRLTNKENSDTIQNAGCTEILKDMLLNIESIEIDDIDLGQLVWSHSKFIPMDSDRPTVKGCVNLGWNGTYTLTFDSPFYLWLLEKM
jgi:hypothetical protein